MTPSADTPETAAAAPSVPPSQAAVAAVGVRRSFGRLEVLAGIDLSLGVGEAVGIVGPNGAGKTTLLSVLAGACPPDEGQVWLGGKDVTELTVEKRCRAGVARAHQVPRPFGGLTVFENVFVAATAGGGLRGRQAYSRCLEALEVTGLPGAADRPAAQLGLLGRKRLELARCVATGASVLLLDEIGAGLTDAETVELVETVRELRRRGATIVWIEHIVHVLVQVAERLVCLDAGRIIADGEPRAVLADPVVVRAYLGHGAE